MFVDDNRRPPLHTRPRIDRHAARELPRRFGSLELSAGKGDAVFWYRWAVRPGDYEFQNGYLAIKTRHDGRVGEISKQKPPREGGG